MTEFDQRQAPEVDAAERRRDDATASPEAARPRRRPRVQAKLEVGSVEDPAEREADAVARRAVTFLSGGGTPAGNGDGAVHRRIGRKSAGGPASGGPARGGPDAADAVVGPDGGPLAPVTEAAIESARGGGSPLPDAVRPALEAAMGADFSAVRVHTDPAADASAAAMGALAFTTGSDIFFAAGQYDPGSPAGQETLAHELTHVVQQSGGGGPARKADPAASADAQGTDIHVGPGQEQHLPHEAWHVVQQAQGRVRPTTEAGGVPVDDDAGLEREADVMGARAMDAVGPAASAGPDTAQPTRRISRKGGKWGKLAEAVHDGQASDLVTDSTGGKASLDDASDDDEDAIAVDFERGRVSGDISGLELGAERVGIDSDGVDVSGIELIEGVPLDVRIGGKDQRVSSSIDVSEEIELPPDGFEVPLLDVKIPLGPGFGMDVVAKIEGGLEIGGVKLQAEYAQTSTDVEALQRVKISGGGESKAAMGVSVEVAMWGGVPVLAAVRAGVRAKAEAEAKIAFEVGGMVDVHATIPVQGESEEPEVISNTGELYINIAGDGGLSAALSAFLGFELFTIKGDLYELVFVDAPLASLDAGARLGARYEGVAGKGEFFAEPLSKEGWINFDWLLGKWWKARKLDAAKEAATVTKADVAALKDLQSRPDVSGFLADVEAGEAQLAVANGALQLLINEEQTLQQVIESDTTSIKSLQSEISGVLDAKNKAEKAKRWTVTNWFKGDIPELKAARDKVASMQKSLTSNEKKLVALGPRKAAAQQQFLSRLDPATIDAMVVTAQAAAQATYKENWKLFSKEFDAQRKQTLADRAELQEELEGQEVLVADLTARLTVAEADPLSIDATALEVQLGKARAQRALIEAKLRKLARGADAGAQNMLKVLTGIGVTAPKAKGGENAEKFAALAGQLR